MYIHEAINICSYSLDDFKTMELKLLHCLSPLLAWELFCRISGLP